ncbi:mucin-5AC-like [Colossoma macropomum]|uniref:mucin-5AC-like n=1 Tax=Colossoma macropomum TaxID=42526 RepID=UPI0018652168|nr:mucin-5AC-like [Colossoma macropomum]
MFMSQSNIEETPGSFFVSSSTMQSLATSTERLTRVDTGPLTNIPKTNEQLLLTGTFTTTEYVAIEETSLVTSTASADVSTTAEHVTSPEPVSEILIESESTSTVATMTPAQQILTSIVIKSATVNSTDDNSSGKEFSSGTNAATEAPSTLPEILARAGSGTSPETLTSTSETLPDMSSTRGHVTPLERKLTTESLYVLFKATEDAQKSPTNEFTPFQGLETFEQSDAITAVTENVTDTASRKAPNEEMSTAIQTTSPAAELLTVSISGTEVDTLKTTVFKLEPNIVTTTGSLSETSIEIQSLATLSETVTTVSTGPLTEITTTDEELHFTEVLMSTEHVASEETSRVTSTTSVDISPKDEHVTSPEPVSEVSIITDSISTVEAATSTQIISEESSTMTAQSLTSTVMKSDLVISTVDNILVKAFSTGIVPDTQAPSTLPEILPTALSVTSPETITATSETLPDMGSTGGHVTTLERKITTESLNAQFKTTDHAQKSSASDFTSSQTDSRKAPNEELSTKIPTTTSTAKLVTVISTDDNRLETFEQSDAITAVTENVTDTASRKAPNEEMSTAIQTTSPTAELLTVSISGTEVDTLKTTVFKPEPNIVTTTGSLSETSIEIQSLATLSETVTTVSTGPLTEITTTDEELHFTEVLMSTEHVASEETSTVTSTTSVDISPKDEHVTSPEPVSEVSIITDSISTVEAATSTQIISEESSTMTAQSLTSTVMKSDLVISTVDNILVKAFSTGIVPDTQAPSTLPEILPTALSVTSPETITATSETLPDMGKVDTLKTTVFKPEPNIVTTTGSLSETSIEIQSLATLSETVTTVSTGPLTEITTTDEELHFTEVLMSTEHVASEETSTVTSTTSVDISPKDEHVTSPEPVSEVSIISDSISTVEAATSTQIISEESSTMTAQSLTSTVMKSDLVISTVDNILVKAFSTGIVPDTQAPSTLPEILPTALSVTSPETITATSETLPDTGSTGGHVTTLERKITTESLNAQFKTTDHAQKSSAKPVSEILIESESTSTVATTTPAQQILTSIVIKSATVNSTDDNSSGKEFSLGTNAATEAPSTLPEILAKAGSGTCDVHG